uniref:Aminotransferase-like plant mobile domain-containing protein n=1 Tax=Solanum tuberosum TaxID=4113 RepID=M1DU21_SOLTU
MTIEGEYRHIPGYWEWTENILGSSQEVFGTAQIYDVIYASLFTYDRNSDILQAFCDALCPKTNTLLTYVGKLSIYLWDLHTLGGLPIWDSLNEEVVSEAKELVGSVEKRTKYIPRTCEYLFAAFHHLRGVNQEVSFSRSDYQSWWKKTHEKFLDEHLQALVDVARPIPVVHLEGSGEVCKNKVLNTGMPSPLGVKVPRKRKIKSQLPSVAPKRKTPTQAAYVSKRLLKVEKGPPYVSWDEVKDDLGYEAHKHPPPAMSVCNGKKVILDAQKDFISSLWNVIRGKISRSDVDSASSLRHEIQPQKELFVAVGERLTNAMFEEQDKVEEVSTLRQSPDNMKKEIRALCKRVQDLKFLLTAVEDEVEGAKLATLFSTQEFDACFDADLTNDLRQKKEHLEAMHQELINYKLCLD